MSPSCTRTPAAPSNLVHFLVGLIWVHVKGSVLVGIAALCLRSVVRGCEPVEKGRTDPVAAIPTRQLAQTGPYRQR
jgi:hypothetical protein